MASSGSFNTSDYDGRYLKFTWSVKSQSIANNSTTITWSLAGAGTGGSSWYKAGNFKVVINGSTVYSSTTRINLYNGTVVSSGTYTINHNSDGNKSFTASAQAGIYYVAVNCTGSGSWSLPQIIRQATITSATNFNDTGNPVITYSNPLGNSATSLKACISLTGSNDDIEYRDISKTGTSYTFNLTDTERNILLNACPNSKTLTVRFYIQTVYNNTTYRNYKTATMTVVNANPTIQTATYEDINSTTTALTQNDQLIIRNLSNLQFTINNLKALKGSTLESATVNINGDIEDFSNITGTSVSSSILTFGTINVSQNITAIITVKDSRGFSTTKNLTIQVLDYESPSAIISLARLNNYYTDTILNVNASYSSLDNKNSITITCKYKKTTDSSFTNQITVQNNTDTTLQLNNLYEWDVQILITDLAGGTATYNLFVDVGIPIVFFDRNLKSMGVNCFPVNPHTLEINEIDIYNTLFFRSGDTFSLNAPNSQGSLITTGLVTNSGKNLHFTLNLPKYLNNISSISVTSLKLNPRVSSGGYLNASGYVTGGTDFLTNFTVDVEIINNNTITITSKSSSAFTNVTNNTPVAVEISTLSLTLN